MAEKRRQGRFAISNGADGTRGQPATAAFADLNGDLGLLSTLGSGNMNNGLVSMAAF